MLRQTNLDPPLRLKLAAASLLFLFATGPLHADDQVALSAVGNKLYRVQYGDAIRVSVAELAPLRGNNGRVTLDFAASTDVPWTADQGEVVAVAATDWMQDGAALAFTVHDKQHKQYAYYWATNFGRDKPQWVVNKTELVTPDNVAPYEPCSLRNPGGDTIRIQWRIRDRDQDAIPVLTYVHICPIIATKDDVGMWYRQRLGDLHELPRESVSANDAEARKRSAARSPRPPTPDP